MKMARVSQRVAGSFCRFAAQCDRLKSSHCAVRAHTMSIAAAVSSRRSSRTHPLRRQRRFQHQDQSLLALTGPVVGESTDSPRPGLFLYGGDGIFGNAKIATHITNSAAIQCLCDDLFFDSRLPRCIGRDMLKTSSACLTPIALGATFTLAVFDKLLTVTRRAM